MLKQNLIIFETMGNLESILAKLDGNISAVHPNMVTIVERANIIFYPKYKKEQLEKTKNCFVSFVLVA